MVAPVVAGALMSGGASLLGGAMSARANYKSQKEFAQHGISWKVADAKRAGIHPLAAIGGSGATFIPPAQQVGDALSTAGQDVGRAVMAQQTGSQREMTQRSAMLSIERQELENDLLRSQIATSMQPAQPPPMPSAGYALPETNVGRVEYIPQGVTMPHSDFPFAEPAPVSDIGFTRTQTGFMPVRSRDATQQLEDDFIGNLFWSLRNRLLPSVGLNETTGTLPQLPAGFEWEYNPYMQEYQPKEVGFTGLYRPGMMEDL